MNKTLKINQIAIDKTDYLCYNDIMKNTKERIMRVSDLEFTPEMRENVWRGHSVEKPKEDAHRMIGNERHAQNFIDEFGDVEIVFNEKYKYWKVPAFKVGRDEYGKLKQAYCDQFGSN